MAVYDLVGDGIISLSSNVRGLFVELQVVPDGVSTGLAVPVNYYHVGLLRLGRNGSYLPAIPIDANQQYVQVPIGFNGLGYHIKNVGAIRVTEDFTLP